MQNPPDLRPDLARARISETKRDGQPTIGMVSLGCPKALVDSERILTRLRAEGYGISPDYAGADAVIVNTCGFLDSAKAESLEAIGEALNENGKVIVTGCLGAEPDYITGAHPKVLAVTGPHQYEQVLDAVHGAVPPAPDPFVDLLPSSGVKLTPRHYSYLKISEGCNHACKFCIIPDMRGKLASRPHRAVMREAEERRDDVNLNAQRDTETTLKLPYFRAFRCIARRREMWRYTLVRPLDRSEIARWVTCWSNWVLTAQPRAPRRRKRRSGKKTWARSSTRAGSAYHCRRNRWVCLDAARGIECLAQFPLPLAPGT